MIVIVILGSLIILQHATLRSKHYSRAFPYMIIRFHSTSSTVSTYLYLSFTSSSAIVPHYSIELNPQKHLITHAYNNYTRSSNLPHLQYSLTTKIVSFSTITTVNKKFPNVSYGKPCNYRLHCNSLPDLYQRRLDTI